MINRLQKKYALSVQGAKASAEGNTSFIIVVFLFSRKGFLIML